MESNERTDAQGVQAGGTPHHEDPPIQGQDERPGQGSERPGQSGQPGQGGRSDESGRIGQGGSELEDEDDENEVGSTRKGESEQGDSAQNPGMQVNASDKSPNAA
jgi:hypothetical protein